MLALDQSASTTTSEYAAYKSVVAELSSAFTVGPAAGDTRLSLVSFSTKIAANWDFSAAQATDYAAFTRLLEQLTQALTREGDYGAGLEEVLQNLKNAPAVGGRTDPDKVVVLISGGMPNVATCKASWKPPNKPSFSSANALTCARTRFTALRKEADIVVLVRLGSAVTRNVFNGKEDLNLQVLTAEDLAGIVTSVLEKVCGPGATLSGNVRPQDFFFNLYLLFARHRALSFT